MPTLDELKDMLGIPASDTSLDDEITAAFDATLAVVERYLGRGVQYVVGDVHQFEPVETRNRSLRLFRFPVEVVTEVLVDGQPTTGWRVLPMSGILEMGQGCGFHHGCGAEPIVRVTYTAGYADTAWPADLMDAILRAFFTRWHATGDTGNTADASTQGPIRSVGVDGSTVTWADFQATALEHGAGPIPQELLGVSAMLDPYRERPVTGV